MDWICNERFLVIARYVMRLVARRGELEALAWLYDKYPSDKVQYETLLELLRRDSQSDVVKMIVTQYSEWYEGRQVFRIGARFGDLNSIQKTALSCSLKRKHGALPMRSAACRGHLEIVQWLSKRFGGFIPI